MTLEATIHQMTKDLEVDTVEWVFRAIEKTREISKVMYKEVDVVLTEQYGEGHSRDKVYARPTALKNYIDSKIGLNVFNVGSYYIDRGVRRDNNYEKVISDVAKDYEGKRANLKNKILKLAKEDKITNVSSISAEDDGRLGCMASLSNGDSIQIYTITAGGWNIQKFHFRGLAKRLS